MIECVLEPIPAPKETSLRTWLGGPQRETLIAIVESKVKFHQARALDHMLEADGTNLRKAQADAEIAVARVYDAFLFVLDEITKQPAGTPFEIAKLT